MLVLKRININTRHIYLTAVLVWASALTACVSPVQQFESNALRAGLTRFELQVGTLPLVLYRNNSALEKSSRKIHIYISGDGKPWLNHYWVAKNPTPSYDSILDLIAIDPYPAILVGRPCYHMQKQLDSCEGRYWTSARYSTEVVDAMANVIETVITGQTATIIGYSGGGALAMLIAPRLPQVSSLVTVAGNLDIEAWAANHRYTPLYESLNPAKQPPLSANIRQLHLMGAEDQNIPPKLIQNTISKQTNAKILVYPKYSHTCCWREVWPAVLEWIKM